MFIDMPQIPFEVYYPSYDKTVNVISGCKDDPKSNVLYFKEDDGEIKEIVFDAVNKAFDEPGIVNIKICRI